MRLVAYIRVSTETQVREGFGLEAQREAIETFCRENGHSLLATYEDAGESGAAEEEEDLLKREGLQDLLASLPRVKPDRVIVLNTSRLWRNTTAKALIQMALRRQGCDVLALDQPTYSIYTKDPTDFLLNGIMEVIDEYSRLEIALKMRRGRITKARRGGFAGGQRAHGYKATPEGHDLAVDEKEMKTVRRIREWRKGGESLQEIADRLNREGIPTERGRKWWPATVRYILCNPLYDGRLEYDETSADRPDLAAESDGTEPNGGV